ncbi:MAG: hypothetical protein ACT4OF_17275 [Caulobacteraceae bacterium]
MSKLTFSRAGLIACCVAAIMAGNANAQERGRQSGLRALVRAAGIAAANTSSVDQQGSGNAAAVVQNGQGNSAGLRQIGRNNTGAITQSGANNSACLIQIGRDLDGSITQVGDNQNTGVFQTRRGQRDIPAEVCALNGDRRGFFRQVVRRAARDYERSVECPRARSDACGHVVPQ